MRGVPFGGAMGWQCPKSPMMRPAQVVHALSNEIGKPTREGGKPLPFEAWGDVTIKNLRLLYAFSLLQ